MKPIRCEDEAKWRASRTEYEREWRKRNPDRVKAYKAKYSSTHREQLYARSRRWITAHPEWVRERNKKYRVKYREKRRASMAAWRKRNPEYNKLAHQEQIKGLADWYVRARMSRRTTIPPKAWPQVLVDAVKQTIKTKRLLWQLRRTSLNSATNS